MKIGQFMSYYKRKKLYQKIQQKLWPDNYLQALLCLQSIMQNLYWKWDFWNYLVILDM